jgi:hypothetical protein
MPPVKKNLEPYKDPLVKLFRDGATYDDLKVWLEVEQGLKISVRSIKDWFKDWGVGRHLRVEVEDHVKAKIREMYFEDCADDNEIIEELQEKEGIFLTKGAIVRMRSEMNLMRRIRGPEAQAEADQLAYHVIADGLLTGPIDGYGKGYLHAHFRSSHVNVQRDRLFKVYKTLNPEGVQRRKKDLQRRRGEYIVPGPNWLWSIDGHDKLKPYGIEIYAGIDAYSRFITWIYVGVSNATAVSVAQQYIHCVKKGGIFPQFVRSDCGGETGMLAFTHYQLSKADDPSISLADCYLYGTSTANQRIEKWWENLTKGWEFRWRVSKEAPSYTRANSNSITLIISHRMVNTTLTTLQMLLLCCQFISQLYERSFSPL